LSRIKIKGNRFVDEHGRVILFRGINAVEKSFPWLPNQNSLCNLSDLGQLNNLKQWGFNTVRLGVMWSGLVPNKNKLNQTYLSEIVKMVDDLASFGIYVIIDLHQDMFSSKFNSYDGIPLWVMDELPKSKFEFPWPLKESTLNSTSVFASYITEACGFAFQCLYDNVNRFNDHFQQYWTIVSRAFANNTAILGYEILNEPWPGDIYANPLLFLPGVAGTLNLMKLYDKTYETIRKHDSDGLIFYEPVTWGVLLKGYYFGTGFTRPPGSDPHTTVLSWHYYCWLLNFAQNPLTENGTYPQFDRVACDNIQLEISYSAVKLDEIALGGGPSFQTEFGICAFPVNPSNDESQLNTDECESILNAADRYLQSWTYWDSIFYHKTKKNNKEKTIDELVNVFSRVYPQATNGMPLKLYFNTTTKYFFYSYMLNKSGSHDVAVVPTEIFVPQHVYYPFGFSVNVSSHLKWSFHSRENKIFVFLADHVNANIINQDNIECYIEVVSQREK
jgi:endoglycosylceramidase